MKYRFHFIFLFIVLACKPKVKAPNDKQGVTLNFTHSFNEQVLLQDSIYILTDSTQRIALSKCKYLLTNFRFKNSDGQEIVLPINEDYFVGNALQKTNQKSIHLPEGTYSEIHFDYGLNYGDDLKDEDNNGVLTDVLNFTSQKDKKDMYWDWANAYRFLNLEGIYYNTKIAEGESFKFHNGSHAGTAKEQTEIRSEAHKKVSLPKPFPNRVLAHRTLVFSFATPLQVKQGQMTSLNFHMDLASFFKTHEIGTYKRAGGLGVVMSGENTPKVANDFVQSIALIP